MCRKILLLRYLDLTYGKRVFIQTCETRKIVFPQQGPSPANPCPVQLVKQVSPVVIIFSLLFVIYSFYSHKKADSSMALYLLVHGTDI